MESLIEDSDASETKAGEPMKLSLHLAAWKARNRASDDDTHASPPKTCH